MKIASLIEAWSSYAKSRFPSKASLVEADLRQARVSRSSFKGAAMNGAAFMHVDASAADFRLASLHHSNMHGANFTGALFNAADLSQATITCADFSGANLSGADLTGAALEGAYFYGANLTGAKYGPATLNLGICSITGLEWPVFIFDRHIKIGCQLHTTEEWEDFEDADIENMALGALAFWRRHRLAILSQAEAHQLKEKIL